MDSSRRSLETASELPVVPKRLALRRRMLAVRVLTRISLSSNRDEI